MEKIWKRSFSDFSMSECITNSVCLGCLNDELSEIFEKVFKFYKFFVMIVYKRNFSFFLWRFKTTLIIIQTHKELLRKKWHINVLCIMGYFYIFTSFIVQYLLKTSKCNLLQFLFKVLAGKSKLFLKSILRHSIYTFSFLVKKIKERRNLFGSHSNIGTTLRGHRTYVEIRCKSWQLENM